MDELERLTHDPADVDWQVRSNTVRSLGKMGERAIAPLAIALTDSNEIVRVAATRSLGELPYGRAVGVLTRALHDPSEWVRAAAATALGKPGNHQVVDALIAALTDTSESVRVSAANSLGEIGNPRAVDPLIGMLNNSGDWVRMSAAYALGQIGGPKALPELRRLAREDKGFVEWLEVSEIAQMATEEIEQRMKESQAAVIKERSIQFSPASIQPVPRPVTFLANKNPSEITAALYQFPNTYVRDWSTWRHICSVQSMSSQVTVGEFGEILRSWQATRPRSMRRPRNEATHQAPFLEDLVAQALPYVESLNRTTIRDAIDFEPYQIEALTALWSIFLNLTATEHATCVGVTKAILLLTQGQIGPAFDKTVRSSLSISKPLTAHEWLGYLQSISHDIKMFESKHGVMLEELVPAAWGPIAVGRVYDMVAGPKIK